jgi:predicted RNA-binding Zn-ribbon protein involved in translation (DUF1610 family)
MLTLLTTEAQESIEAFIPQVAAAPSAARCALAATGGVPQGGVMAIACPECGDGVLFLDECGDCDAQVYFCGCGWVEPHHCGGLYDRITEDEDD